MWRSVRRAAILSLNALDLQQRRPPGDEALVGLGVEPGRHGEAGHGQPGRKVSHGHEVILENLGHAWPPVWLVLEKLLDEVFGQRTNSAWHMVLILLNPVQRSIWKINN